MSKKFQSTGPLRDPTTDAYAGRSDRAISIHRSLAGPDRSGKPSDQPCGISIHRSLAGPDGGSAALDTNANDFNPQVPCGTRQGLGVEGFVDVQFQSTGPLRDPTSKDYNDDIQEDISIHRSLAGPDIEDAR